ncbi:MAG TPA: MmgE/PrpD family protein, partial [Nitrolancea sp.]|nr:MmgE/PrpD family protein [Nitrolancea sp.]
EDFTDEHIADREIQQILSNTFASEESAFTAAYPGAWASTVRVTLDDGSCNLATVHHPKGMPANPMDDAEIEQKFHDLVDGVVGQSTATDIIAGVAGLSGTQPARDLAVTIGTRSDAILASGS